MAYRRSGVSKGSRIAHKKRESARKKKLLSSGGQIDPFGHVDTRGMSKAELRKASVTKGPRDGAVKPVAVAAPAPRQPFVSAEQVLEYVSRDRIECLECGSHFQFLPRHIAIAHRMDARSYRAKWAIPAGIALAGIGYRNAQNAKMLRMIAEGVIEPAHQVASAAAVKSGRGERVAWLQQQHAQAVAEARPGDHSRLPPGAKRADGRDADHAREYQQKRRRKCGH